jgi:D-3-phosphoglycerate dehydrogenase
MDVSDWDSIEIEKSIMAQAGCEVFPITFSTDADLLAAVRDADAVIPRYINIERRHIEAMPRCQIIARSGIGVDIVDVEAATQHGIWVTNVPRYCEEEVADHSLALILACVRKIGPYHAGVRKGIWHWQTGRKILRISQSTFGMIGFGKIGQLIWSRMKAFGCRGMIFDPYVAPQLIQDAGALPVSFNEVLEGADILHIQAPLTAQTKHLIGEKELRRMKPTAVLTNAARGPIIVDQALFKALTEGWIAAAGLDDLEEEPAKNAQWKPDNPLLKLPNVIVTPHSGWYSEQSIESVKTESANDIVRVLSGLEPLHPVNQPVRRSD